LRNARKRNKRRNEPVRVNAELTNGMCAVRACVTQTHGGVQGPVVQWYKMAKERTR